ncbi:TonB-dependent receptor plug domain-containing protein [Vibrio harveyi]
MSIVLLFSTIMSSNISADEVQTVYNKTIEESLVLEQSYLGGNLVIVDREKLEQFGQSDINDILNQFVPGLFSSGRNGRYDSGYYSLQGSRKKDILWLIDGNRLNNRLYGGIHLDSLNPNIIERIEVLKGGQSIVFGSDAIAGIVNIVTRNYQGEDESTIGLGLDTLSSYNADGFISKKYKELEWSLFGSVTESDGYQLWQTNDIHWTASNNKKRGYQVFNIGTKLRYTFDNKEMLTLLAQYNTSDLERLRPYATIKSNNQREEKILTLDYQNQINDILGVQLKSYYHGWDSYYNRTDQNEVGEIFIIDKNSYWGFEDFGIKLNGTYHQNDLNNWLFGIDLQRYRGKDEVMNFTSELESVSSIFGQYRPSFYNTNLALGMRYSDITDAGDSLNWSLGGQYDFNNGLTINGLVATGFRLPSAEELYSIEEVGGVIGNPELDPESSLSANLGMSWSKDNWYVEPLLFWRTIDNLIGLENNQFKNLNNKVETRGIELYISTSNKYWDADLATSYNQSYKNGNNTQIATVPNWLGKASINYQVTENVSLWNQVNYTGKFTDRGKEAGDYWLFHVGAQWTHEQHKFSLRIENLLNNSYTVSIFNPGRTAPEGYRDPIYTRGLPRNLQINYRYQF